VSEPDITTLVTLDQVKDRLNIDRDDTDDDDELTLFLASASGVLVDLYGDVIPVAYTEVLRPYGDGCRVMLSRSPVLSVESVSVSWYGTPTPAVVLSPTRYWLDGGAGILHSTSWGGGFAPVSFGGNALLTISYTAGRATVTAQVQDAVLEILRINWAPQRATVVAGPAGADMDPDVGFTYLGYYIPNGAHERLAGGKRPRQIA
jgi:hypothetical protein